MIPKASSITFQVLGRQVCRPTPSLLQAGAHEVQQLPSPRRDRAKLLLLLTHLVDLRRLLQHRPSRLKAMNILDFQQLLHVFLKRIDHLSSGFFPRIKFNRFICVIDSFPGCGFTEASRAVKLSPEVLPLIQGSCSFAVPKTS